MKGAHVSASLIFQSLAGRRTPRPPFWLMRQAGRYLPEYRALRAGCGSFLELCLDPVKASEVTMQPVRRFHPDAAILFSDILVVPLVLGQDLRFEEGRGPVLDPLRSVAGLSGIPDRMENSRIAPIYETASRVRGLLPDDVPLIGFAGAPWTVATYMIEGGSSRDYLKTKLWLYRDPRGFAALIDLLVETTVRHLDAQIAAGAGIVKLFDSWAGVLSAPAFEQWCIAPTRRIAAEIRRRHPGVPMIGFPRGAGAGYAAFARRASVDAVALDTAVCPSWAARVVQPIVPVQGNLDPAVLVAGGGCLAREVRRITRALSGAGHIFNLGHGVLPSTPPAHVEEMARLIRTGSP